MEDWKRRAVEKLQRARDACDQFVRDQPLTDEAKKELAKLCVNDALNLNPSKKGAKVIDPREQECIDESRKAPNSKVKDDFLAWCYAEIPKESDNDFFTPPAFESRPASQHYPETTGTRINEEAIFQTAPFREPGREYNIFECNYCKRKCHLLSKSDDPPFGCLYVDEFIHMGWKLLPSVSFHTSQPPEYQLFICDYCVRNCNVLCIASTSERPLSCPFLDEFLPVPWNLPEETENVSKTAFPAPKPISSEELPVEPLSKGLVLTALANQIIKYQVRKPYPKVMHRKLDKGTREVMKAFYRFYEIGGKLVLLPSALRKFDKAAVLKVLNELIRQGLVIAQELKLVWGKRRGRVVNRYFLTEKGRGKVEGIIEKPKEKGIFKAPIKEIPNEISETEAQFKPPSFKAPKRGGVEEESGKSKVLKKETAVFDTSAIWNCCVAGSDALTLLCQVFEKIVITSTVEQELPLSFRQLLREVGCIFLLPEGELSEEEKYLTNYFQKRYLEEMERELEESKRVSKGKKKKKDHSHKGEMEALAVYLTHRDYDVYISDNEAPFVLRRIAISLLVDKEGIENVKQKLMGIKLQRGRYILEIAIRFRIIKTYEELMQLLNKFEKPGSSLLSEKSKKRLKILFEDMECKMVRFNVAGEIMVKEKRQAEKKFNTDEEDIERSNKLADAILKDWDEHEAEDEEAARQERKASLERNWSLVKRRCTPEQIEGIKFFVENGNYSVAADLADMSKSDFMELLVELGISRCII